uniref:Uncharacterized protein n=1 Tax=Romanomermis culicivorax TaxID=13658 RepID=A0A915IJB8_ROMCU
MHLIICSPNADSIVMTTGPWALTTVTSATLILPHIGSWSDCLSNACLTNPDDNTEHRAPVSMSALPSLIGIWKALVEAYLWTKVFDDGVRFSIWQTDERMWHGSQKTWPVAFQQTIPGLTIGAADAISLEGMTIRIYWAAAPNFVGGGQLKVCGRDSGPVISPCYGGGQNSDWTAVVILVDGCPDQLG